MGERDSGAAGQIRRRRFLGGLGAGGLAATMTVFGKTPAYAANWQCCNLACGHPTISIGTCEARSHYTWSCTTSGGFLWCRCCETYGKGCTSTYKDSAGSCQYG
jgi:hypothetical protein